MTTIDKGALVRALTIRDLTDPTAGPHAIQLVVERVASVLAQAWKIPTRVVRASPVTTAGDNYDALAYPPDGAARDARYTRWIGDGVLLRTQMSALVPAALRALAGETDPPGDVLLICPGMVYRRDQIDRLHTGEPHQLDLWRVRREPALDEDSLEEMIGLVVGAALPGRAWRTVAVRHPYTTRGRQIDVAAGEGDAGWIEIGECGLAAAPVLARGRLRGWSGLAMGLGLDRLVMIAKGIDDIRLLRSTDPRIAAQMLDLAPYRPVSTMPPIRRDLSLAMAGPVDTEILGDRVRSALGDEAEVIESIELLHDVPGESLPAVAAARLGLVPGQRNVLLRVVLRAHGRTLTANEASRARDRIYAALHQGTVHTWALGPPGER
jgi:phenylalanyl-tRNA synthetase alpha chain